MGKLTSPANSMVYSILLALLTFSLQQVFSEKLASSEWLTILGGFISSVIFLFVFTFLGNVQEYFGVRSGWVAVIISLLTAVGSAALVHRVSCTTCVLFSLGILYEVNEISKETHQQSEGKKKQ